MRGKTPSVKTADKTSEPEDQVRLKPFLGIRPGVYLAVIYGLVAAAALFFALVFPGIKSPGSVVVFSSVPSSAALRVDGVYAGTAPCEVFVPRGGRVFEAVLPGFESETVERAVPGRLVGSWLFPRRITLNMELTTSDPAAALAVSAADYAAWTFGGEPTAAWQAPLSLSEGAARIGAASAGTEAEAIIAASARFAVTRAALRDLVRAKFLSGNGGLPPASDSLVRSAAEIIRFLNNNPGSAAWLAETLPQDSMTALISSQWYQKQLSAFAGITEAEQLAPPPAEAMRTAAPPPADSIRVGGLLFTGVGAGVLVQGEPFPGRRDMAAFMICSTQVPAPAYADFLDENPQWRPQRRQDLVNEGLVNSEYLADFEAVTGGAGLANAGINAVSWHAAKAFCDWLSGKLPDSFIDDWEVRLPTEAEWEYAAKSMMKWDGYTGIYSAENAFWEWCDDPYSPLPFLAAGQGAQASAVEAVSSPERNLRGGTGLNGSAAAGPEKRASLPPAVCSPFVSFRPVIARKAEAGSR